MSRRGVTALVVLACLPAMSACVGDDGSRIPDRKIIDRLNLEQSEGGYAIDGDPFCEVSKKLLNTADELESAADRGELDLVVASAGGNVGVEGIPPFANDCRDLARKQLSRLDPKPKD